MAIMISWARICKLFKEPLESIDSIPQPGGPVRQLYLMYRPARLHRLEESIPCNRFLVSLNIYKLARSDLAVEKDRQKPDLFKDRIIQNLVNL